MGAVSNSCFSPSIFTSLGKNPLLSMKSMDNITMISKGPSKLSMVSSKLSESSIEEKNPTSNGVSDSKTRMEDYNLAMKRRMRNPYEYHHDLGQFHFCLEFDFKNPSSNLIKFSSMRILSCL